MNKWKTIGKSCYTFYSFTEVWIGWKSKCKMLKDTWGLGSCKFTLHLNSVNYTNINGNVLYTYYFKNEYFYNKMVTYISHDHLDK